MKQNKLTVFSSRRSKKCSLILLVLCVWTCQPDLWHSFKLKWQMTPGMPLTETKIHYHINKSEKIFYVRMYDPRHAFNRNKNTLSY